MHFTLLTNEKTAVQLLRTVPDKKMNPGECHVWVSGTDYESGEMAKLRKLLNEQEARQANAFRRPVDQRLYGVTHGLLRLILAHYTGVSAKELVFIQAPGAKPTLDLRQPSVYFNLSHAFERVIIAVSLEEIGVDVAKIQADFGWQDIAEQFFSPSELAALRTSPEIDRTALFYKFWTRKEAWLKAVGLGLVDELPDIEVSKSQNTFWLANNRLHHLVQTNWQGVSFPLEENYLASLFYPFAVEQLTFYQASALLHRR